MSSGKKTLESFYATLQGAVTKFFERDCHIRPCFPKWAVLIQMLKVLNDKWAVVKFHMWDIAKSPKRICLN